jgi:hypothetical protein
MYFNNNSSSSSSGILLNTCVNVGVPANGTIAANGTVTLTIALNTTYSNGIWLWFPAGAVSGGSAGLYWTVMSSTTVGVVYTNYVDPTTANFTPFTPTGTLVAVTGSNLAYTQTAASALRVLNVPLAAGTFKETSRLSIYPMFAQRNGASAKVLTFAMSGTTIASFSNTTINSDMRPVILMNAGVLNRQITSNATALGTNNSTTALYTTIDTSVATSLTLTINIATATTDYVVLNALYVELK